MPITQHYVVTGMTCRHCVASVTEEVSTVPGVTEVVVDLDSGQLVVISDSGVDLESVEAAVDEAGYTVVAA